MQQKWTIQQTKRLFDLVYDTALLGQPLSQAFIKASHECHKTFNCVRSYYYSQLKIMELMPDIASMLQIRLIPPRRNQFVAFTTSETNELIERILLGKANGKSVRAIINDMANGNQKIALRLQNKYRSTIATHRDTVLAILSRLHQQHLAYFDPYKKCIVQ